jgi:hypothetical protein
MDEIQIRPLKLGWSTWVRQARGLVIPRGGNIHEIVRAVSLWAKDVDAWATALPQDERKDAVDLLKAETDMLWAIVDPPPVKYTPNDDDRLEFRNRYYEALMLLNVAERHHFPEVGSARREMTLLESYATTKRDWLP